MESTPVAAGVWAEHVKTRPAMRDDKRMAVSFNRGLWKCCTLRTVPHSRILNPMQDFLRCIDGPEDVEVFNRDHFLTQQSIAYPVEQAFPVFLSDKNHRERLDLSRLDQGNCFEQLVERSKSSRQYHERDRVLHEHYFSNEEIA